MLEFQCPSCGKRVQGDDSLAGKHVVCPGCGTTVKGRADADATGIKDTLPTFPRSHRSPDDAPMPSVAKSMPYFAARLIPYFVAIVLIVIAALLMVPKLSHTRRDEMRVRSTNNLKEIGMAMHGFHDTHKRFPFNGTMAAVGGNEKTGSWAFQLLPFIEQNALFMNCKFNELGVPTYCCPRRSRNPVCSSGPWSDYCVNPWLNDPLNGAVNATDRRLTFAEITDGTSSTIFAGEGSIDPNLYSSKEPIAQSTDIFKGGDPTLARRSSMLQRDTRGDESLTWGGPFTGALMLFCDGRVRMFPHDRSGGMIRNGVADRGFAAFLTPAGNELAVAPD